MDFSFLYSSYLDQFLLTRCSLLMFNFMAAARELSSLSLSFCKCKCAAPLTQSSVGSSERTMCRLGSKHPEIPQKRQSCNMHVTAMFKSVCRGECVFSQVSWQIYALGLAWPMYPTGCQLSLRKTERWRIGRE